MWKNAEKSAKICARVWKGGEKNEAERMIVAAYGKNSIRATVFLEAWKSGCMCGKEKVGDTHAGIEKLKMRTLAVKARKTRYKNC